MPAIDIVEECIFVPGGLLAFEDLLYDRQGLLVEGSVVQRTQRRSIDPRIPDVLPDALMEEAAAAPPLGEHLFLGTFRVGHYGHWLTEGLARFWPLVETGPDFPILAGRKYFSARERARRLVKPSSSHWRVTLNAFGLNRNSFSALRRPRRVQRVHVPQPSMVHFVGYEEEHLRTTRYVGSSIWDGVLSENSEPVYLSRSRVGVSATRNVAGELAIEALVGELGVRVVHPERMSLASQVRLFSEHSTFVGLQGSAFHTVLLSQAPPEHAFRMVYLTHLEPNPAGRNDFHHIDALMGNSVTFVDCLTRLGGSSFEIDLGRASRLRELL